MANVLTGRAAVYGLAGTLTYTGRAANTDWLQSSASLSDDAEVKQDLTDPSTSEVIGKAFGRKSRTATIEFIPTSDSDGPHSAANAAAGAVLPAIPSKITLASFAAGDLNGDWIYEGGGSVSLTPDGYAKMTLPLKKYADSSSTATILTTSIT